jgi:hypothetical protein
MKLVLAMLLLLPLHGLAQGSKLLMLRAHVPFQTTITISSSGEAIVKSNSRRFVVKPVVTTLQKNKMKLVTVVHP